MIMYIQNEQKKKNGTADFVFFLYISGKVNNDLKFPFVVNSTFKVELIWLSLSSSTVFESDLESN